MTRAAALLCCCLLIALPLEAAKYFRYTDAARDAYELVLSLRFEEARQLLAQMRQRDPENLIVHHIENYIDFFTVYINEDPLEYERLVKNRDLRLMLVEQGDPDSPYYRFVQADIRLHWAIARLKFGEYLGAFREVSKAYRLLEKNREVFPDFLPNYKDLSVLHAMVGTIPDAYRWGVKLLSGMDGSIDEGRREMEMVLHQTKEGDFVFRDESIALYAWLMLHLDNEKEAAWKAVDQAALNPRSNLLHCFVLANIAMRTGRNDRAIELLQYRPRGKEYFPFHYLDFMLGSAKLRRLDPDADRPLLRYAQRFQGQNFIKEAYQKLAWHALLQGNKEGYTRYMQRCMEAGSLVVDSDKSAQAEAESGAMPTPALLRARLLFDGAYYQRAYDVLAGKADRDFPEGKPRLEYYYRRGRLLHGLKHYPDALRHYRLTIDAGWRESWYYACNAALQSGLIYELLGRNKDAVAAFQQCLDLRPEEYRTGLHQQAKAGLARLRNEQN